MPIIIPTQVRALLTTTPPAFKVTDVEKLALDLFGIRAKGRLLASERDQNFRLDGDNGKRYTFKVSNHAEETAVVEFQNGALQHIAGKDPDIPVPRVISNLEGAGYSRAEINGQAHMIRMLSWMDGQVLYDVKAQSALLEQMGTALARLGLALKDFDHPGSNPPLLWDMKRAGNLRDLLPCMEDSALQSMIEHSLDRFDKVEPELMHLRQQVIYNDLNPDNVLIVKNKIEQSEIGENKIEPKQNNPGKNDPNKYDPGKKNLGKQANDQKISGIIDFGDLVKSPLIIDVAVAAAYYLSDGDDPLSGTLPLISAYHRLRPLQPAEIQMLPDLIRTRLISSLLIMSWRISEFPENRDYLQRSQASSKAFLTRLSQLDDTTAVAQIRGVCP